MNEELEAKILVALAYASSPSRGLRPNLANVKEGIQNIGRNLGATEDQLRKAEQIADKVEAALRKS